MYIPVLNEEKSLLFGSKINKKRKLEGVRYPCNKCEYSATKRNHLTEHIKNKHEGVRYPCDKCEYAATRATNLRIHIKSKH